jgi:hypothetical protein
MATRVLESRFERMSVNDENDPGDGMKYQKSKVLHQHKLLRFCANFSGGNFYFNNIHTTVSKCRPSQSAEACITESKHNKHHRYRPLPSSSMESFEYAKRSDIPDS